MKPWARFSTTLLEWCMLDSKLLKKLWLWCSQSCKLVNKLLNKLQHTPIHLLKLVSECLSSCF